VFSVAAHPAGALSIALPDAMSTSDFYA